MKLPHPRGPVSETLLNALPRKDASDVLPQLLTAAGHAVAATEDVLYDDDLQLALFCLYELHYGGLDGVDDRWEWDVQLLQVRALIEQRLEARLRASVAASAPEKLTPQAVADRLFELAADDDGPSVSAFLAKEATPEQAKEFVVLRSVYQLKEADPHTWAIPRLRGRAKSAMVEIQADEYGGGKPGRIHAELFARTMQGLGLDPSFGAYVDCIPAITLASVNTMSLFGLQRRLRGAICGHLAIYEMTSSIPNGKYARGFRRLGFGDDVTEYFDEHVEADAVHEQIAGRDLAGGLIAENPDLAADVFFGAGSALYLDGLAGGWQLDAWTAGRSALRQPLEPGREVAVAAGASV